MDRAAPRSGWSEGSGWPVLSPRPSGPPQPTRGWSAAWAGAAPGPGVPRAGSPGLDRRLLPSSHRGGHSSKGLLSQRGGLRGWLVSRAVPIPRFRHRRTSPVAGGRARGAGGRARRSPDAGRASDVHAGESRRGGAAGLRTRSE